MDNERCPKCGRDDGLHAQLLHRAADEQQADGYTPCGKTAPGFTTACLRQEGHAMPSCVLPDPDGVTTENPAGLLEIGFWPVGLVAEAGSRP